MGMPALLITNQGLEETKYESDIFENQIRLQARKEKAKKTRKEKKEKIPH